MDEINKKLSSLSEISKSLLSKILNSVPGPKDLTLQAEIIKPLERICGVSWLKVNGVEKIYKFDPKAPKQTNTQFFMIYSNIETFKQLLDLIQSHLDMENPEIDKYHIICVPKYFFVFETMLEELGLYQNVIKLYSLQWYPIYLDVGLLTLEIPNFYKSLYVNKDLTLLTTYAKSLWQLYFVFGKPQFIASFGQYSNLVLNQYDRFYKSSETDNCDSDFNTLIIMDRNLDYPSVLLTPATYSSLIKETYPVVSGVCELKEVFNEKYDNKCNPIMNLQPIQFALDSSKDSVYKKIKYEYVTQVTAILSDFTKELKHEGESSRDMNLHEIKNYVRTQLQAATSKKRNVTNHLIVAEAIINTIGNKYEKLSELEMNLLQNKQKSTSVSYIEEILQTENDKYLSMAYFCLILITQQLSDGECKSFLSKYFLEFGYDLGFVYKNLIKANFMEEFTSKSKLLKIPSIATKHFYTNSSKMSLVPQDASKINLKKPTCCSYVFGGGYIPLLAQIVSLLLSGTPLNEIKSKLSSFGNLQIINEHLYPMKRKSILIYMIGGITYSEIAALDLLQNMLEAKIVVISDLCISRKDIVEGLIML